MFSSYLRLLGEDYLKLRYDLTSLKWESEFLHLSISLVLGKSVCLCIFKILSSVHVMKRSIHVGVNCLLCFLCIAHDIEFENDIVGCIIVLLDVSLIIVLILRDSYIIIMPLCM